MRHNEAAFRVFSVLFWWKMPRCQLVTHFKLQLRTCQGLRFTGVGRALAGFAWSCHHFNSCVDWRDFGGCFGEQNLIHNRGWCWFFVSFGGLQDVVSVVKLGVCLSLNSVASCSLDPVVSGVLSSSSEEFVDFCVEPRVLTEKPSEWNGQPQSIDVGERTEGLFFWNCPKVKWSSRLLFYIFFCGKLRPFSSYVGSNERIRLKPLCS